MRKSLMSVAILSFALLGATQSVSPEITVTDLIIANPPGLSSTRIVTGRLRNDSGRTLRFLRVEVMFEASDDSLVDSMPGLVMPGNLQPGATASFRAIKSFQGAYDHVSLQFIDMEGNELTNRVQRVRSD